VTVSNGAKLWSTVATLGLGSSNNTATLFTNSTWNLLAGNLTIGSGAATGNVLTLAGGSVTNAGAVTIGNAAGAIGNSLNISNGASFYSGNLTVGTGAVASNNSYNVGGLGAVSTVSNGLITVGTNGAAFNTLTITNVSLLSNGGLVGATGSSNNLVSVLAGGSWNLLSNALVIGALNGSSTGNVVLVSGPGAVITNVGLIGQPPNNNNISLLIGAGWYNGAGGAAGSTNSYNSLIISNGGKVALVAGSTRIGDSDTTGNQLLINNGTFSSPADMYVGVSVNSGGGGVGGSDSVTVTNGGSMSLATGLFVGSWNTGQYGISSNTVTVAGANSLGSNATINLGGGLLWIGNAALASNNQVVVNSGGVLTNAGPVIVGGAAASAANNSLTVTNGGVFQGGAVTVGAAGAVGNTFKLSSNTSTATVAALSVTTGNTFAFNGGVLNSSGTYITNGLALTVGDGTQSANLNAATGTHGFNNGLIISSNAWLTGTGNLNASGTGIVLNAGAVISPGTGTNGIGTLTLTTVGGFNGAVYDVQINNVAGTAGINWDELFLTGNLTNRTGSTNFVIRMDSLGTAPANYITTHSYSLPIATYTSPALVLSNFTLDTSAFVGSGAGTWTLTTNSVNGVNTLFLTQVGTLPTSANTFIWTNNASTNWSVATAWNPPTGLANNGGADYVLQFTNNAAGLPYIASNNLVTAGNSFTNNAILFNSSNSGTNVLAGATLTFAGSGNAAGFYQNASTAFIVSNSVNLATNIVFDGAGEGALILASNITGTGQITLQGGAYNTVLQGSNTFAGLVLFNSSGTLTLGTASAFGTNSVTVSNGTVIATVAYTVGNGWSNQPVLITGAGAAWTNAVATFTIGNGAATSNSLSIDNGGSFLGSVSVTVGTGVGASNNAYNVGGFGTISTVSNGTIIVGTNSAAFNTMTVTNATLLTGTPTIGSGSSNNTVTVLANATWNLLSNSLTIGANAATGNVLLVNGGTVTKTATVVIGNSAGSVGNGITLSNGAGFFSGNVIVGNVAGASNNYYNVGGFGTVSTVSNGVIAVGTNGAAFNTLTITNANLWSSGAASIGALASNNSVNVLAGGTWNAQNNGISLGTGTGTGNVLTVNGGLVTNVANLYVGGNAPANLGGGNGNSLVISNGGQVFVVGGGAAPGGDTRIGVLGMFNNRMIVDNGTFNSTANLMVGVGSVITGGSGDTNSLTVANGGYLSVSNLVVGSYSSGSPGYGSSSNTVTVAGANAAGSNATINLRGGVLWIGNANAASNNLVLVGAGGVLTNMGAVTVGGTGGGGTLPTTVWSSPTVARSSAAQSRLGMLPIPPATFTRLTAARSVAWCRMA